MNNTHSFDEAHLYIEKLLAALQTKPRVELEKLILSPSIERKSIGEIEFEITSWAKPHEESKKLGVLVEARRHRFLGWSQVTAVGFFIDQAGTQAMTEEDFWSYGY